MTERLHWHRCRDCDDLGRIDDDQLAGRVSIECHCGAHYTLKGDE